MEELEPLPGDDEKEAGFWNWKQILGLLLILLATLTALYILIAYLAWQSGQSLRDERETNQRAEQLAHQVELAQEDIVKGSYNLALRRLEWVLQIEPQNQDAKALRSQAQAAVKTALTPIAAASPTPLPEPSATPGNIIDPGAELSRLNRLANQQKWVDLLPAALAFQRQFPDYDRLESDSLLYDSYLNLGLEYVQGSQVEVGIYYLSQAEKLGNLSQEALDNWLWAELYLQGIAYYGVNWGVAASFFRDLCLSAPFFQNACAKLYDSLVAYGDQFAFANDWCPAVEQYREAIRYNRTQELNEKLGVAIENCALATPTPPSITGTLPITGTGTLTTTVTDE